MYHIRTTAPTPRVTLSPSPQVVEMDWVKQPPGTTVVINVSSAEPPPLPPVDSGVTSFPLSRQVSIDLINTTSGVTISVHDLSPSEALSFTLQHQAVRVRVPPPKTCFDGILEKNAARCEWYDPVSQVWRDDGCTSQPIRAVSMRCTCSHLTVFSIRQRTIVLSHVWGFSGKALAATVGCGSAFVLALVVAAVNWVYWPDARPICVLAFVAGWCGLGVDVYTISMMQKAALGCGGSGLPLLPYVYSIAVVTVFSMLFNGVTSLVALRKEMKRSDKFNAFAQQHPVLFGIVWLASFPTPTILYFLGSRIFGTYQECPRSEDLNKDLHRAKIIKIWMVDCVQLVIVGVMYAEFEAFNSTTRLFVAIKAAFVGLNLLRHYFKSQWTATTALLKACVLWCWACCSRGDHQNAVDKLSAAGDTEMTQM
mmetsp:Transcript_14611/g.28621  ORF Transcript_14611/g.28621 Transcript_14611/m.28621 type:complete len:423 (+) Transcript_14611:89-1357(+)